MQAAEFYRLLDEVLELDPGTLHGDELLEDLENWDSLAVISYIALVDEQFGVVIEGEALVKAKSVADLYTLAVQRKAA
jgi:acyl carrier protein